MTDPDFVKVGNSTVPLVQYAKDVPADLRRDVPFAWYQAEHGTPTSTTCQQCRRWAKMNHSKQTRLDAQEAEIVDLKSQVTILERRIRESDEFGEFHRMKVVRALHELNQ